MNDINIHRSYISKKIKQAEVRERRNLEGQQRRERGLERRDRNINTEGN